MTNRAYFSRTKKQKKAEPFDAYLQLGYRQVDLIV